MTLPEDQNNTAFGMLDQTNYPSNRIYDRTDYVSKVLDMDGNNTTDIINYDDWLTMYAEMELAIQSVTALVPPVQEDVAVVWKRAKNRYEETDDAIIEGNLNIPIGIINYNYHKLKPNAIDDNLVFVDGESLKDTPGATESPFEQRRVFAATPMLDTVESQTLHFIVDADFYFQNTCANWTTFRIDFADGNGYQTVTAGSTYTINYPSAGDKIFRFEMNCGGTILENRARLHIEAQLNGGNPSSRESGSFYDEVFRLAANNVEGKLGVKFGCGSNSFKKPILFVSGYNPFSLVSLESFYDKYNNDGLLDDLVAKGFDVCVFRSNNGADSVGNGASLLIEAIDKINSGKNTAGHFNENIVIGYSYGAVVARMALARMERDFFANDDPYHQCKLYFSYEGEHQGASIILGYQHALESLSDPPFIGGVCALALNLADFVGTTVFSGQQDYDSHLGREILLNLFSETGTPANPAVGAHPTRLDLIDEFENNTNHPFTEVNGYPALLRNVALSKGASDGSMHNFDEGEALFGRDVGFNNPFFGIREQFIVTAIGDGEEVFLRQRARRFLFTRWFNIIDEQFEVPAGTEPVENANGSTISIGEILPRYLRFCGLLPIITPLDFYVPQDDCFVPVYSGLDIRNRAAGNPYYDVIANELLFDQPNTPNDFYGYPHLRNNNPLDITPFEGVFCIDVRNGQHSPDKAEETDDMRIQGAINRFFITEIQPDTIELQNQRIGQHLPSYKVDFEAINRIEVGNEVTFKTPVGNVSIENQASVRMRAGNAIVFEPGALIERGSVLDAQIETFPVCASGIIENDKDEKVLAVAPQFNQSVNQENHGEQVTIIPNPSDGNFTIELASKEVIETVYLYTLSGQKLAKFKYDGATSVSFIRGTYIIKTITENGNVYLSKILIQ